MSLPRLLRPLTPLLPLLLMAVGCAPKATFEVTVVNKTDQPPAFDLNLVHGLRTVGTTGAGIDDLRRAIRSRFGLTPGFDETWPRWWTPRHKAILVESLARVDLIHRIVKD